MLPHIRLVPALCPYQGASVGIVLMGTPIFAWPAAPVAVVLAGLALAGCAGRTPQATPAALPAPELPAKVRASEIVGRWGYAAYHKPEDRARTEKNARGQCRQPFVIGQGPSGGV